MLVKFFFITSVFLSLNNCKSSGFNIKKADINETNHELDGQNELTESESTNDTAIIENNLIQQLREVTNSDFSLTFKDFKAKAALAGELNNDMIDLLKKMDDLLLAKRDDIYKIENLIIKYPVVREDIVKFNVGGIIFATFLSTITKKINKPNGNGYYEPNLLQALVSGFKEVKLDENKAIFIDRSPKNFHYMLDYLRMANKNETFKYPTNFDDLKNLLAEAHYYNMVGLREKFIGFSDSKIINSNKSKNLIKLCNFSPDDYWMLIYRGSRDGFKSKDFHKNVDGMGSKTLTLIRSENNYIFGGYTEILWDSNKGCLHDRNTFLFGLLNENINAKKVYDNNLEQCWTRSDFYNGPKFGNEIFIADNANKNKNSYSGLVYYYKINETQFELRLTTNIYNNRDIYGNSYDVSNNQYVAGSYNFRVDEIEVYAKI